MARLSDAKLDTVRGLIELAPDTAVRNLLRSLAADGPHDVSLTRVQRLLEIEAADRNVRNMTFGPIAPLCAPPSPFSALVFPTRTLPLMWRALRQEAPREVEQAKALMYDWRGGEIAPHVFDDLCARAANGLRAESGPFDAAAAAADQGGGRLALAGCLDLAPLARNALEQLREWLGRMTGEKAAKLRLTYRDVVAISEDAGPRFFEMLTAHLNEPWLILRVIAGVMAHPNDVYVAGSEFGSFGERVLADIDRRLDDVAAFKATSGRQAAHGVALTAHLATVEIAEIEQSVHLTAEGAWGRRVAQQKHRLAESVEALLKMADRAIAAALPLHTVRLGPRTLKGVPRLTHDPDPEQTERAATLLTVISELRSSAAAGGFAASRAKVIETVENRLDAYVEDILLDIHADDGVDQVRARAFLNIAAELSGLVRDEKAAQIIRRRAAAA